MKTPAKIFGLVAIAASVALAAVNIQTASPASSSAPATHDPFADIDRIFQIQMQQMRQMQQQMDAMFRNFEQNFQTPALIQTPHLIHSSGVLSSGFQDKGDHYALTIRVNDLNNSKVNITTENGMITITTTLHKKEEKNKGSYGKIISYANSSSTQSFTLPPDADEGTIKAEQNGNAITITMQKKKSAAPSGKVIPIQKKDANTSKK